VKVFILEDDPERITYFHRRFIGHDLTVVSSCVDIEKFDPPYDIVFFDHDLGGRQMAEHEDNGANFARAVRDKVGEASVIIHSYNRDGALSIAAALRLSGVVSYYAPFRGTFFERGIERLLGSSSGEPG
jgi:hypothetical protein